MYNLSKDTRTLNKKISDMVGCNIGGRINYVLRLLDDGDIQEAKIELRGLLIFIEEK